MKKNITLIAAALTVLCLTSCCNNEPTLSASKAKSLAQNEMARLNSNVGIANVPIGYFECNDPDTRYALRQLAACEMITYSCERVQKPDRVRKARRVQRGYYYTYYDTEYYWVNDTVTTYFVTTALTEKGQKLLADTDFEIKPTDDEKELKLDFTPDTDNLPESSVTYDEFGEGAPDPEMTEGGPEEELDEEPAELASTATANADTRNAYERAKAKEAVEMVAVKAYIIKIVKARNIVVSTLPAPTAKAELVMEYTDVTPFGRVLNHVYNGQRRLEKEVSYVYYQDKKWVLDDID